MPKASLLPVALILFAVAAPALAGLNDLAVKEEDRAFLGVGLGASREGIRITQVEEGSAAEAAGLETGDVIVAVDGSSVRGHGGLRSVIQERTPGDGIQLTVRRDGEERSFDAVLGSRSKLTLQLDEEFFVWGPEIRGHVRGTMMLDSPGELEEIYLCEGERCRFSQERVWYRLDCLSDDCPTYRINFWGRPMLGIGLTGVTAELREHFGSDGETGVLVSQVYSDSPADRAGIEVGDLIIAVEGRPIGEDDDIRRALRGRAGSVVEVELLRDGRTLRLDAEIADAVER